MFCQRCCHASLETIIPPQKLYGNGYKTKTSNSVGASIAVAHLAKFIKDKCDLSEIPIVLDIGGNDYALLHYFQGRDLVAIDPNATRAGSIHKFIEDADLSDYKEHKKLIVSSHTIEHLENPEVMIRKIAEILGPDDIVALQFPSLELLVRDARIDQIHHQHVSYFSERSISSLLAKHGIAITHRQFDDSHWGALMLIAKKGVGKIQGEVISKEGIQHAIASFEEEMMSVRIPKGSIALGASLMLPVLNYWVSDLGNVEFIADDDISKDGLRYVNFNKAIGNAYDLEGRDVVITALGSKEAYRSLTRKAMDAGARNVILPMRSL